MRRPRTNTALSILLLLAAVSPPAQAISDYALAQYRLLAERECVDDPGRIVPQGASLAPNRDYVLVRHMGDPDTLARLWQVAWPVTWDVGEVTGFRPPQPTWIWQRGYQDLAMPRGTNAFQFHCRTAGFMINTWGFPHTRPVAGGGPHMTLQHEFLPTVPLWQRPDAELTLQAALQLPWRYSPGGGVAQVSFVYYLRHPASGTSVAHVIALFDSRAAGDGNGGEFVANDGFSAFASSPLADRTSAGTPPRYVTRSPYSQSMVNASAWRGLRFFRAHVKREQAAAMLAQISADGMPIDTDPSHWQLQSAMVFVEVIVGTGNDNNLSFGGSIDDLLILEGTDPP
jgi:hypothetical protein